MPSPAPKSRPAPWYRRLRVYTFDPSLATQLDTALINPTVLRVPWEALKAGPVGEYPEVIDYDPASGCFYDPVNLDEPELLAVAMTTTRNFEVALVLSDPDENLPGGLVFTCLSHDVIAHARVARDDEGVKPGPRLSKKFKTLGGVRGAPKREDAFDGKRVNDPFIEPTVPLTGRES